MISYQDAVNIVIRQAQSTRTENIQLLQACGRVATATMASAINVPSFRNSAMDGFAVRIADIATASEAQPVTLISNAAIAAGDAMEQSHSQIVQIMTGAPVPEPFDAVVPIENVMVDGENISFTQPAKLHANIRFAGEDVQTGQTVLAAGEYITPEKIMLLAAVGIGSVEVAVAPKLFVLSTGKELIDSANEPLAAGKIYNSNAPYLLSCAKAEGLEAVYGGVIADDAAVFEKTIRNIPENTVVISTGAVSKGTWDFIPDSLKKLSANIHFHRVNIRPGKPVLFATLPNGSYYFGLPGNPISAAIGFRFFVKPLLRALQGLQPEAPMMARLANGFSKKGNFRQFLKAELTLANAQLQVHIQAGQESFKISPMAHSNAWVVLEEGQTEWKAGDLVPVYPYASVLPHSETKENMQCKVA